jgi:hypothetical protein
VAEEAARLLDALSDWGVAAARSAGHPPAHATNAEGVDDEAGVGADDRAGVGADDRAGVGGDEETAASRCPSCGAENGAGRAVVCQLCPVCHGLGLLRSVRPETVDRLADLAGAIAVTLRDLAADRREAAPAREARASRVEDIAVEDTAVEDLALEDLALEDLAAEDLAAEDLAAEDLAAEDGAGGAAP